MSNKKIAYIVTRFPTPTETFIIREVEEIKRKGIEIKIFSLKSIDHQKITKAGLNYLIPDTSYLPYILSIQTLKSLIYFLFNQTGQTLELVFKIIKTHIKKPGPLFKTLIIVPKALNIASILREQKITRIHAHWATIPTTAAWLISELNNYEFTFTAHAWDIFKQDIMLEEKIRSAKKVITCTKYNKKYLLEKYPQINPDKIEVIYHGLNLDKIEIPDRSEHKGFTMLSVGRLVRKKGFDVLLRACEKLVEKGVQFNCQIVYVEGESRNEIFDLHNKLGLKEHVEFIPEMPQEKLYEYYYHSDCFVLPSIISETGDRDGIPNVFLEALATGLPVVSTDISGIPEIVINNKTGLLVEPNNVDGLAAAIEKLYLNKNLRAELGHAGRELVSEKFDNRVNVDRLLSNIL